MGIPTNPDDGPTQPRDRRCGERAEGGKSLTRGFGHKLGISPVTRGWGAAEEGGESVVAEGQDLDDRDLGAAIPAAGQRDLAWHGALPADLRHGHDPSL